MGLQSPLKSAILALQIGSLQHTAAEGCADVESCLKEYNPGKLTLGQAEVMLTVRMSKTPFTHAWSCRGCDQKGPPMIHPEPVSGHCWGTAGPCPGANLKPLPLGDCIVHCWD